MGRGESKIGGGSLTVLQKKAQNAGDNDVLNSVKDSDLGAEFQKLGGLDKNTIHSMLALHKRDIEHLSRRGKTSLSQTFTANGARYKIEIGVENNNVVYSLKKRNKYLVKNGSYINVANQMALIVR